VDDLLVLGTTQGLKTRAVDERAGPVNELTGIDSPVHQIAYLPSLQTLVLATGGDGQTSSQLVTVSTRTIKSGIPVKPEPVPEVTRCHVFAASQSQSGSSYLCAANQHHVTILEWSGARGQFVLRNKFSTDKHTSCIFFTEHSVLVGTTKFYEIDLKNFSAEEFLDTSDPGVSQVLSSPDFQGSLPLSVLKVPHSKEPEYLLCFTRHVLFVDGFGQQTREPMTFSRLPVEQRLMGRVLVTSFSDSVQLLSMDLEKGSVAKDKVVVWVPSPHLVGQEKHLLYYTSPDVVSNNLVCLDLKKIKLSTAGH
jgi:citron Rho-interacting kinase